MNTLFIGLPNMIRRAQNMPTFFPPIFYTTAFLLFLLLHAILVWSHGQLYSKNDMLNLICKAVDHASLFTTLTEACYGYINKSPTPFRYATLWNSELKFCRSRNVSPACVADGLTYWIPIILLTACIKRKNFIFETELSYGLCLSRLRWKKWNCGHNTLA